MGGEAVRGRVKAPREADVGAAAAIYSDAVHDSSSKMLFVEQNNFPALSIVAVGLQHGFRFFGQLRTGF